MAGTSEVKEYIGSKNLKNSTPEPFKSSVEMQDSVEFGEVYLDYLREFLKDKNSED